MAFFSFRSTTGSKSLGFRAQSTRVIQSTIHTVKCDAIRQQSVPEHWNRFFEPTDVIDGIDRHGSTCK